jgi:hypothetical protein
MELFFNDPNVVKLPPEEVRLREVRIIPLAGGGRVKIHLELTPFQKRPDISVTITSASGKEAARTTILETMLTRLELTMHLHEPDAGNEYAVETVVFYQKLPLPSETGDDIELPEPLIVDRVKTTFTLA